MNKDIEKLLKTTIQTKVNEQFNTTSEIVDKLVEAALSKEVDETGKKPSDYISKKMPFMEWLIGEEIRKAVQMYVHEYVEEHKETIKLKVRQSIPKICFGNSMADTDANVISESYNRQIKFKIDSEQP